MNDGEQLKLSKHHLISVGCLFYILLCFSCLAVDTEPIGWATLDGGITGGQGGEVVTVTNKDDFVTAVSDDTPRIVQVVGTIHGDYNIPNVGSHKTIVGIGYDARIVGFSVKVTDLDNVIVRNLTFSGAMPQDGLICRRATHLWIDHCTFYDAADGQLDFSDQCDYVTVSWCKFYYTSKINDHRLTCLVGSTDDNPADVGKLNITWHHNWWGNYADQRMPRGRYGQNHVFNNYYSCTGNYYCIGGSWGFQVLAENNYFDHVNNPLKDAGLYNSGASGTFRVEIKSVGNIFDGCTGSTSAYGDAFVPSYTYTLDPAADIPSIVQEGTGTTILIGDPALWPTKATVPAPANGDGTADAGSTLTWRPGSTAVSHNIYFGTSPTGLVSYGSQTAASFTPPTLARDTEYYWRIDEVTADESVITGGLWMFKTVAELPAELYHYWPFDVDFVDVATEFSSNPNNPFGAAWLDADAKLLGGGCLDCTYAKDGLIAGWSDSGTNNIFPDSAPMTISLWFKPTALPSSDNIACILGSKTGDETSAKTFRIELLPSGACRLTVDSAIPEFGNSPTLNGWNHVLVSIDASGQLRAWLNANETGSITLATSASNNYNGQYIGIGFYGDNPNGMHRGDYNGYIDDVAIWNVSSGLTFAEILYTDGTGRTAIGDLAFATDPIGNLDGIELAPYAGQSLTHYADGIGTFSKESGPDWLLISPGGNLSGTPKDAHVGQNTFTVRYESTSGDYDTATMMINVVNTYSGTQGLTDLAGLAVQWLVTGCVDIPACDGADLSGDNKVDILDVEILARNWLADESLQLYLKFNETSGDIADDDSIYGHSGQLVNGPTWAVGTLGGALSFDGVDDYVLVENIYSTLSGRDVTVSLWMKAGTKDAQQFLCAFNTASGGNRLMFGRNASSVNLGIYDNQWQISNSSVFDGAWHHVAYVLSSALDLCTLYVDGNSVYDFVTTTLVGDQDIFTVGQEYDGLVESDFYEGLIDDLRIYSRSLTQQEIQDISQ
ncbi:MAG: hypothetical protein JW920_08945 [Deltaproteobacteria bacterium]|nr:hypothetical protein [Deltaproteobacteria bacterium]